MDDVQRNIVGGVGVALAVAGPVGWLIGSLTQTRWPWPAVVAPPVAMFIIGVFLIARAWTPLRGTLRRSIKHGNEISRLPTHQKKFQLLDNWQESTFLWLNSTRKPGRAATFREASKGVGGVDEEIKRQVAALETMRWRRRKPHGP